MYPLAGMLASVTRATSRLIVTCAPIGPSRARTWKAFRLTATIVYADPPYDVEFTHDATDGFAWDDQQRTAEWLATHRGPVVLVNQATERVEKLYRKLGYRVQFLEAPRRISCTGNRTPAREIMGTLNV